MRSLIAPATSSIGTLGIDPVLVVEIDAVGPEALERALDHLLDVLGSAVETARFEVETELGRDDDLVAEGRERFSDELFVRDTGRRLRPYRRT